MHRSFYGLSSDLQGMYARLFQQPRKYLPPGASITEALGRMLGGGIIELDSGTYFINSDYELTLHDITIIGQGDLTVLRFENGSALEWSGARGRLLSCKLDGITAGARATSALLTSSGDDFVGDMLYLLNCYMGIEGTADNHHLTRVRVTDQTNIGILSTGDNAVLVGNRVEANAVANEISSTGANAFAVGNYCIGGGINVAGAGSYAPVGSNFV
jgi:hypothetical protein